jgi:UDP-2,3-diacylglucosamine hydrolase
MRICVVSDVHFKYESSHPADRENSEAILSFLKDIKGTYDLLVLNGDIFDLWFDWKFTIIKQYFPLLRRLADIREADCRVVLISGNHDFWFNDFFTRYLDVEVHDDSFSLQADGRKMLFTHGDLHTVNDLRYKFFRRLIRLRGTKALFSLLHPDLALFLGAKMSRSSRVRRISSALQAKKSAGLTQYATYMMDRKGYDLVCMGHSHRPALMELKPGRYYANSGDWIQNHSFLEITDGVPSLQSYTTKENNNAKDLP